MTKTTDQDAQKHWVAFQGGDRDSFAWLYETYAENLYNYGYKFVADAEFIEDTLQDIFIRIWHSKERLKVPPSVKHYLMAAFRNLLFRKLSQLKDTSMDFSNEEEFPFSWELPYESQHIEEETLNIRHHRLRDMIQKLTPRQKEALFLRFYEEASYEEIAAEMKISVKGAYKVMARAIKTLKTNWFEQIISAIIILDFFPS